MHKKNIKYNLINLMQKNSFNSSFHTFQVELEKENTVDYLAMVIAKGSSRHID